MMWKLAHPGEPSAEVWIALQRVQIEELWPYLRHLFSSRAHSWGEMPAGSEVSLIAHLDIGKEVRDSKPVAHHPFLCGYAIIEGLECLMPQHLAGCQERRSQEP